MKKIFLLSAVMGSMLLTSCATVLTPSHQTITFNGLPGTQIFDKTKTIAKINDQGFGTAKVKKQMSTKTLTAKLEGYRTTPFELTTTFNPVAVLNLASLPCWAIDIATGKVCKYSDEMVTIEMERDTTPAPTKE